MMLKIYIYIYIYDVKNIFAYITKKKTNTRKENCSKYYF